MIKLLISTSPVPLQALVLKLIDPTTLGRKGKAITTRAVGVGRDDWRVRMHTCARLHHAGFC